MNSLEKFRDIRSFIFDVDGVMTDGMVHVLENGELLRRMNVRDAYAIRRAIEAGFRVIVITAGKSEGVKKRLEELGVKELYMSVRNKLEILQELTHLHNLDLGATLYMGDDVPDYDTMRRVHFPVCPSDAVREIIELSQYVSPFNGGQGCVRDVIEKAMRMQGEWTV